MAIDLPRSILAVAAVRLARGRVRWRRVVPPMPRPTDQHLGNGHATQPEEKTHRSGDIP